jgi:hypothetical protein
LSGVEFTLATGDTLHYEPRVAVDQNTHLFVLPRVTFAVLS